MAYRYPKSAAAGLVDAKLAHFKKYVETYWDLVPGPEQTRFRGDNLSRMKPSMLLGEVAILFAETPQPERFWALLHELKKAAWVPNHLWDAAGRPMERAEFWALFRDKLISAVAVRKDLLHDK